MCKTYTWACRGCRALQDITYRCSSSHLGSCLCRTPVAGLPPDAQYKTVTCCYCHHTNLPAEASSSSTCTSNCVNPALSAPLQQQPDLYGCNGGLAAFHQGLHTSLQQRQTYTHVTPHIDPALLALDSTPDTAAETPAQQHWLHSTPMSGEYQPVTTTAFSGLPSLHQPSARRTAVTDPQSSQHAQKAPPFTPPPQQPYHLPSVPHFSPLRLSPYSTHTNRTLAALDKKRMEIFERAAQAQLKSRESGQREKTPRAEELDQAWAMLRATVTRDLERAQSRLRGDDATSQRGVRGQQHSEQHQEAERRD